MCSRKVSGTWSKTEAQVHINLLELWTVFRSLNASGKAVLVKTDNSTVVAYINQQGGTKSLTLCLHMRVASLVHSTGNNSLRSTHTRDIKRSGRQSIPGCVAESNRMVTVSTNSSNAIYGNVQTLYRPLCIDKESLTSSVLLQDPR